jgi:dUTP pyrophosphatase
MKIQVLKNETYQSVDNLPKKGTDRATGFDVIVTSDPEIVGETYDNGAYKRVDYIQYKTNLKLAVQKERVFSTFGYTDLDFDILAFPRSSISKYNLVLANCIGLIDADYRGEVLLRFKYQWQPEDYSVYIHESNDGSPLYTYIGGKLNIEKIYKKGDKVCQLKITKVENVEFVLVDELDSTTRGEGGFGSTDTKSNEQSKQTMKNIADLYEKISGNITTPSKKYVDSIKERERQLG